MKKFFICVISLLAVIISIIIVINIRTKKNTENEKYELGKYYFDSDNESTFLEKICNRNGNWKNLPLSDKFLAKYNEKYGIFEDIDFDKVEVNPYVNTDEKLYLSHYNHIILTKNNKKYVYQYDLMCQGSFSKPPYYPLLDDIVLSEPVVMEVDNNGNFEYKRPMTDSYKSENIYNLLNGGVYETSVATTEHFKEKYPYFLDLFIHYSPLSFNKIKFFEDESDLDNNIAIFSVDSVLECKKRKYKVELILDDKLYLDDCEVELLEETTYKGNSNDSSAKALYLNSNLDNTNLSDDFIKKLETKGSYFPDIEDINIDIKVDVECINNDDYSEYISCYKMKDGNTNSYYEKFYIDMDGKISNIISERLQFQNLTAIEVAENYLKSTN